MKVVCPKCHTDNEVLITGGIGCCKCNASLDKYKFFKPFIPGIVMMMMGAGTVKAVNYVTEQNRYPVEIEYSLVEQCVSADKAPLRRDVYRIKRYICMAALEQTQEEFNYSDYLDDDSNFMNVFGRKARALAGK